ncbi:Gag-Pol polyprotein, partial [Camponotus floridanus]
LLFVLNKESSNKTPELRTATEKVLGENATVRSKTPEVDLEIKDLDEITTKEEILEALQRDLGTDCGVTLESVRSLRNGYGGTKTAAVRLAAPTAKKLLERTHIRVPWTDCSVREVIRPLKFYTCWHFGHLYKNCKSRVDRSKSCIKCGVEGHKVANCKTDARCALCAEGDKQQSVTHTAGSSRC